MRVVESTMEQNSGDIFDEHTSDNSKPIDVSSRIWKLFLDSKCSSATVFFRLHLSARTYFNNPTPWNPGSAASLSRKVTKLLDSFRPGSTSYSPFQSNSDENNNQSNQNNANLEEVNNDEFHLVRPSVIAQRVIEGTRAHEDHSVFSEANSTIPSAGENDNSASLSPAEENRRRLYLNLGRPRPFYRVPSRNDVNELERTQTITKSRKKKTILTLKEEARNKIVATHGLKNLHRIIEDSTFPFRLPEPIKNFLFTFPCQDFEEDGFDRPPKSASYNVRCNIDNEKYTAIFATSEVDKAVSNLWKEEKDWLGITDVGVTQILAIAVDPLTENIFYISPERGVTLTEFLNAKCDDVERRKKEEFVKDVKETVTDTLNRLHETGKFYGPLKEENIFVSHGDVLIENKLLVKNNFSCEPKSLDPAVEHLQNLERLSCMLQQLTDKCYME